MRSPSFPLLLLTAAALIAACSSSESENRMERDPEQLFLRLDRDGDKRLSWDEFREMPSRNGSPEERFERMDKDLDGYVSHDEFLTAREEFRRSGQGGPGSGRHGGGRSGGGRY